MNSLENCRVLYIASGGIEEPLIQSQVLNYISRLAESISLMHLVTFERSEVTPDGQKLAAELRAIGVEWTPVFMRSRVPYIGRLWDLQNATHACESIVRNSDVNLVHARSFLPGRIGLKLKKRCGVKFLYDMRGFWALEKRAKGTLRTPLEEWWFQQSENELFRESDHMISLTDAGIHWLRERGCQQPITMIPTCTDLQSFACNKRETPSVPEQLISVGSLGPGYLCRETFAFFKIAKEVWPSIKLRVVSRTKLDVIHQGAHQAGCSLDGVDIGPLSPREIPQAMLASDVGLCFIAPSEAKIASCPTKLGEYLATGLPVVADKDCGDVAKIVEENRVGVIPQSFTDSDLRQAVDELKVLLQDNSTAKRCRETAERIFGLDVGVQRYQGVYEQLIGT